MISMKTNYQIWLVCLAEGLPSCWPSAEERRGFLSSADTEDLDMAVGACTISWTYSFNMGLAQRGSALLIFSVFTMFCWRPQSGSYGGCHSEKKNTSPHRLCMYITSSYASKPLCFSHFYLDIRSLTYLYQRTSLMCCERNSRTQRISVNPNSPQPCFCAFALTVFLCQVLFCEGYFADLSLK